MPNTPFQSVNFVLKYLHMRRFASMLLLGVTLSAMPLAASAASNVASMVILRPDSGLLLEESKIPPDGQGVGGFVAHDLGNDGVSELVVGSGQGIASAVRVLRGDGSQIASFAAFDASYRGEVRVAAGDITGDGAAEIVAATGPGVSGRVRVFDTGIPRGEGFLPYGAAFRGGLAIAVGDWNGDGREDIATAPSAAGGPHIKLWDGDGKLLGEFSAFEAGVVGEFALVAGDMDRDGKDELIIARAGVEKATVRVLSPERGQVLHEFQAGPKGHVSVTVGDLDADGILEIILVGSDPAMIYVLDGSGVLKNEYPVAGIEGTVRASVGSFGYSPRLVVSALVAGDAKNFAPKFVEIDISEQRLRAYEYGKLVRSFLVATGDMRHPTPLGDFSVIAKPYKVNYKWTYAPGSPDNYDLGWVTWNLRFAPHIYVHYAPWRAKFGVRGSHGCVNVSKTDAQWIYEWAQVGTPITVQE